LIKTGESTAVRYHYIKGEQFRAGTAHRPSNRNKQEQTGGANECVGRKRESSKIRKIRMSHKIGDHGGS